MYGFTIGIKNVTGLRDALRPMADIATPPAMVPHDGHINLGRPPSRPFKRPDGKARQNLATASSVLRTVLRTNNSALDGTPRLQHNTPAHP